MRQKSVFPSLIFLFLLIMGVAHLSRLRVPETRSGKSSFNLSGQLSTQPIEKEVAFEATTDTTLSTKFRLITRTGRSGADQPEISYKNKTISKVKKPVFDSVLECYYDDKLLFKETSLKQLAADQDHDNSFWRRAGLESFKIDMISSDAAYLVCRFSFSSGNLSKRNFTLVIDRNGGTCITEAV